MRRFVPVFLLILAAGLSSCATPPAAGLAGSSVWKISRDGNALFLGGSVHLLRGKDFPLPKEFDKAFARAAVLVLEADTARMSDEGTAQYLLAQMLLPEGQTLESLLEPETYELLKAKCGELGLPIESVSGFKPSTVMTTLAMLELQRTGIGQAGVDEHYLAKARKAKKPLDFLETVEAQIDMLTSMGDGYENDYVRYSLGDMENTERFFDTLVSNWRTGDAAFVEEMLAEMEAAWPALYAALLANRNAAWLPRLEGYLSTAPVEFVIVGLAHLHGPDGLLRQLEACGCTVEQFR